MATVDQVKSLIRTHCEQDNERFKTFAKDKNYLFGLVNKQLAVYEKAIS